MTTKKTAPRATTNRKRAVRFHILTIFPNIFESYLDESLFKRAQKEKLLSVKVYNIRDYTDDRHNKVDDRPFGGGPGMVLKVQPIWAVITAIKKIIQKRSRKPQERMKKVRTIIFSPRGKKFDAAMARRLAHYNELILICGRYEGVDERVAEHLADEAVSIGDYVLSGGELPALVLMEAVSRQLPGFLGKEESLEEINGSFPTYTRPEIFMPSKGIKGAIRKKWKVPAILLSGDHKKIGEWRREKGATSKE